MPAGLQWSAPVTSWRPLNCAGSGEWSCLKLLAQMKSQRWRSTRFRPKQGQAESILCAPGLRSAQGRCMSQQEPYLWKDWLGEAGPFLHPAHLKISLTTFTGSSSAFPSPRFHLEKCFSLIFLNYGHTILFVSQLSGWEAVDEPWGPSPFSSLPGPNLSIRVPRSSSLSKSVPSPTAGDFVAFTLSAKTVFRFQTGWPCFQTFLFFVFIAWLTKKLEFSTAFALHKESFSWKCLF